MICLGQNETSKIYTIEIFTCYQKRKPHQVIAVSEKATDIHVYEVQVTNFWI